LNRDQLEGLEEVLPQGYPREGGLVVLRGKKGSSRRSRRRYHGRMVRRTPWYRRCVW